MNTFQIAKKLKELIAARKWDKNIAGDSVFGSVKVTQMVLEDALSELRLPFVLIRIGSADTDETGEEPGLLKQNFNIILVSGVEGDNLGERSLLGSNVQSLSPKGRGLLEVEMQLLDVIREITQDKGIKIIGRGNTEVAAGILEPFGYISQREYNFVAYCTDTAE